MITLGIESGPVETVQTQLYHDTKPASGNRLVWSSLRITDSEGIPLTNLISLLSKSAICVLLVFYSILLVGGRVLPEVGTL